MSLQAQGPMATFADRMYRLWCIWNNIGNYYNAIGAHNATAGYTGPVANAPAQPAQPAAAAPAPPPGLPPGLNVNPQLRRRFLNDAIRVTVQFMPVPPLVFQALPVSTLAYFNHQTWNCTLNSFYFNNGTLTYGAFLKLFSTIYHEIRHAEQFYRIAQGLAGGRLEFPDQPADKTLQAMGRGTVRNAIDNFDTIARGGQGTLTAGRVANLMNIPLNIAQAASNNAQASFDTYTRLARPGWFKRPSIRQEVEDWLQAQYSTTGTAAQPTTAMVQANARNNNNTARPNNIYAMYASHPMEYDAFSIEDSVKQMIENRVGVTQQQGGAQQRNGNLFAGLPNL
ncbi:hypothetical protein FKG94_19670 [Exilibacterium tricleocarpae]|uniref:Uncharacterized protein n=1 Tax=Exilibacterium tricleocarpae TaxID=2591008 RepID=A0A545T2B8_9GAMM|nr:hypothetical protein [Exilibacterium tricleocarpae]TQV71335.1 hypothetical protein FKG94_19670 [Exilibacterium tricleocarpae]